MYSWHRLHNPQMHVYPEHTLSGMFMRPSLVGWDKHHIRQTIVNNALEQVRTVDNGLAPDNGDAVPVKYVRCVEISLRIVANRKPEQYTRNAALKPLRESRLGENRQSCNAS